MERNNLRQRKKGHRDRRPFRVDHTQTECVRTLLTLAVDGDDGAVEPSPELGLLDRAPHQGPRARDDGLHEPPVSTYAKLLHLRDGWFLKKDAPLSTNRVKHVNPT